MKKGFFILTIIVFGIMLQTHAQVSVRENTTRYSDPFTPEKYKGKIKIQTHNGYVYRGYIFQINDTIVKLMQGRDSVSISRKSIYKIVEAQQRLTNVDLYDKEVPEKMMLTPTNSFLKKGDFEYSNYFLIFNQVKYGFSDKYNLGIGFSLIPSSSQADSSTVSINLRNQFYFFTQKISLVQRKGFELSLNSFFLTIPTLYDANNVEYKYPMQSYHFLSASYFTPRTNLTLSIGQGYYGGVRYGRTFQLFGSPTTGPTLTRQIINADYFAFASISFDLFSDFSIINENIFTKGLWNSWSNTFSPVNKVTWSPVIGGRYYWKYYSSSIGFGPNTFYADVAYYF